MELIWGKPLPSPVEMAQQLTLALSQAVQDVEAPGPEASFIRWLSPLHAKHVPERHRYLSAATAAMGLPRIASCAQGAGGT